MALDQWKKRIAGSVAGVVKLRGYRKRGMQFSAEREGATLWVGLQSSTGSTQSQLKVTCNLGIVLHALSEPEERSLLRSHWTERIGFYLPEPHDRWWVCVSDDDAGEAGREIAGLLEARGLPEMERLGEPGALEAMWKGGRLMGLTEVRRSRLLAELERRRGDGRG